jgi:polar amino acid transport system substrate-binding protein
MDTCTIRGANDPRVADLVRAGKVRVGLFPGQYTKESVTGEQGGLFIEIARGLAARLGVEVVLVEYPTPPKMLDGLKAGACDVGFVGSNRPADVGFSPPFLQIDFTYLVPAGSSIRNVTDADQPGVRIVVVRDHLSTLALSRIRKQAETVSAETPDAAFDLLRTEHADVLASVRPALLKYSTQLPGSRVLEDRYGANLVAMVVAKGQAGRLAYIGEFIEVAKVSGLVQRAITSAGWRGAQVAPAANPNAHK